MMTGSTASKELLPYNVALHQCPRMGFQFQPYTERSLLPATTDPTHKWLFSRATTGSREEKQFEHS